MITSEGIFSRIGPGNIMLDDGFLMEEYTYGIVNLGGYDLPQGIDCTNDHGFDVR